MVKRKLKIYLDTTIPNFVFNPHTPDKQETVTKLFEEIDAEKFEAYISQVVIDEVEDAPEPKRSEMLKLLKGTELLAITKECEELAEEYIVKEIIPRKNEEDALHIAIATYYEVDALVSYNFEHIVRLKTKREVPVVNMLIGGYRTPDIITPEEVF
ncbi:type II toxin-antitoxin system VapC family toxin [bacterium]|nr:type II toxin-antitoxin system VapC family toxin [bacterium]